jgi:hypothetical protein
MHLLLKTNAISVTQSTLFKGYSEVTFRGRAIAIGRPDASGAFHSLGPSAQKPIQLLPMDELFPLLVDSLDLAGDSQHRGRDSSAPVVSSRRGPLPHAGGCFLVPAATSWQRLLPRGGVRSYLVPAAAGSPWQRPISSYLLAPTANSPRCPATSPRLLLNQPRLRLHPR